jgi:hypothetical protein
MKGAINMISTIEKMMGKIFKSFFLLMAIFIFGCIAFFLAENSMASPSTTFWTPCTPYVQPYKVLHVTYDTYYARNSAYPITTGLTMGILPFEKIQAEVGYDTMYPGTYPLSFNAKIGSPEGVLGEGSWGWTAGIFGFGTQKDVSDYNIVHFDVGKTFPVIGTMEFGVYQGLNDNLMKSSTGELQKTGFMAGWFSQPIDVPYIDKIMFTADVMTGKNAFGAWGGGLYIYFTPAIDLLVGPVFFFDKDAQATLGGDPKPSWLWTAQIDIDIDMKL